MNVFRSARIRDWLGTMWPSAIWLTFICLSVVLCGGGSALAGPNYHGRVSKAKAGELVVVIGTEEFTFIVPASARIRVEGRPGSLEAIRKGSTALVVADRFGDVHVARRIDARGLTRPKSPLHEGPSPHRESSALPAAKAAELTDEAIDP